MRKRSILSIAAALMVFCLGAVTVRGETSPGRISLAVLPCSDAVMNFKKFHPLVRYIEQSTGLEVELLVPKDAGDFEWTMRNHDIDFVLQDPHTYVSLERQYKRNALLRTLTRDGKTYQYGLFVVRKDSGINNIKDLKGKTVMFGPKLSSTKWVAATQVLEENGIDIDRDLKAYQNGGCCEDIVFNVCLKAVDAGVVCEHFIQGHTERQKELGIDVENLKVIGQTGRVPTRVLAARKGLPDRVVTMVNGALLRLDKTDPKHARILLPAELGGFKRAKDSDYDSVRAAARTKPQRQSGRPAT